MGWAFQPRREGTSERVGLWVTGRCPKAGFCFLVERERDLT